MRLIQIKECPILLLFSLNANCDNRRVKSCGQPHITCCDLALLLSMKLGGFILLSGASLHAKSFLTFPSFVVGLAATFSCVNWSYIECEHFWGGDLDFKGLCMHSACVPVVHIASQTSSELYNHFPQRLGKNGQSLKRKQLELLCALQRVHLNFLCELFIGNQLQHKTLYYVLIFKRWSWWLSKIFFFFLYTIKPSD